MRIRADASTRWRTVRPRQLPQLLDILRPREWGCVTFTSRLHRNGAPTLPRLSGARILGVWDDSASMRGAVMATRGGMIVPCIESRLLAAGGDAQALEGFLTRGTISMVMGVQWQVDGLCDLIRRKPTHTVRYHLMTIDPKSKAADHSPPSLQIRPAVPADLLALLPLQCAYEEEEVLLPGRTINRTVAARNLAHRLQTQRVFVALDGETPVAMAGTNARGFDFDQVGGVYTVPAHRNRGISRHLMRVLMEQANTDCKQLCLFVKPQNGAACTLYRNLGFTVRDWFSITYYAV
ncbi:MAG: GNAT family N-acetyltransferase [Spirochaetaceae bacterium]|nr:MAG: GNAT family N-acetyltransferase [Spirochaetaceae bacterium]